MSRKKRRKFTLKSELEAVSKVIVDDLTYTNVGKEDGVRSIHFAELAAENIRKDNST